MELMKRTVMLAATVAIGLMCTSAAFSQDQSLTLEAGGLKTAGPPRLFGQDVLLSYQFAEEERPGQIHTVQAAFEHESYSLLHPFRSNEAGVFILRVNVPEDLTTVRYRLVVDGLWTVDPNAPSEAVDRWGVRISQFTVSPDRPRNREYPSVTADGTVEFRVLAESGRSVAIVGSFNGWDPFMTPMMETQPGTYSRILRLPEGEHLYYFMIDGLRLPDPGNALRRWNVDGMPVSVVRLP